MKKILIIAILLPFCIFSNAENMNNKDFSYPCITGKLIFENEVPCAKCKISFISRQETGSFYSSSLVPTVVLTTDENGNLSIDSYLYPTFLTHYFIEVPKGNLGSETDFSSKKWRKVNKRRYWTNFGTDESYELNITLSKKKKLVKEEYSVVNDKMKCYCELVSKSFGFSEKRKPSLYKKNDVVYDFLNSNNKKEAPCYQSICKIEAENIVKNANNILENLVNFTMTELNEQVSIIEKYINSNSECETSKEVEALIVKFEQAKKDLIEYKKKQEENFKNRILTKLKNLVQEKPYRRTRIYLSDLSTISEYELDNYFGSEKKIYYSESNFTIHSTRTKHTFNKGSVTSKGTKFYEGGILISVEYNKYKSSKQYNSLIIEAMPHGVGTYYMSGNSNLKGHWKNGQLDHYQIAEMRYDNGTPIEGYWIFKKRVTGVGTMSDSNDWVFLGEDLSEVENEIKQYKFYKENKYRKQFSEAKDAYNKLTEERITDNGDDYIYYNFYFTDGTVGFGKYDTIKEKWYDLNLLGNRDYYDSKKEALEEAWLMCH